MQRRLGDAQQDRLAFGPDLLLFQLGVDLVHFLAVDLFANQQGGIAGLGDLHLLEHLANNHLDMLVVDLHALQTIDLLHFGAEIFGERLNAEHVENIVRIGISVDDIVTALDEIAFLHRQMPALGHHIFNDVGPIFGAQDDAALGLVILPEFDPSVDLCDHRIVLGLARLEQFGHPRQTAGDVASLGGFARDTGQHVTGVDLVPFRHRQNRVDRQQVARCLTRRIVEQGDARPQIGMLLLATGTEVDNHLIGDAGCVIDGFGQRHAFDQVLILNRPRLFGDDRQGVRIPFGQTVALGHRRSVNMQQRRSVGDTVHRPFTPIGIDDDQFAVAGHRHDPPAAVLQGHDTLQFDGAVNRRFQR